MTATSLWLKDFYTGKATPTVLQIHAPEESEHGQFLVDNDSHCHHVFTLFGLLFVFSRLAKYNVHTCFLAWGSKRPASCTLHKLRPTSDQYP